MKTFLLPLLISTYALSGTVTAQNTTLYDGTYAGSLSGEVACATDPPVPPVPVPLSPFQFVLKNGVAVGTGVTGSVDPFGHLNINFPVAGVGGVSFAGTITFDGHVNNGSWMVSGLPPECTEGGSWSAARQTGTPSPTPTATPTPLGSPPVPSYVPQLTEFPPPSSLFSNIDFFVATKGAKFSPDSQAYLTAVAQKTKPLTDPNSESFLKHTAGSTADGLKLFCDTAGLIKAGIDGELVTMAGAVMATIPFLDLTKEQETNAAYASLLKILIASIKGGEPVGLLIDLNLYIYGSQLAPALQQVAVDPVDPNYKSIVVPDPVQLPQLPSSGNGPLDIGLSKSFVDAQLAQSFLRAANTSYDRYSSAYAAGDAISTGLQLEALLYYLSRYDQAIQDSAVDLRALPTLLAAAGISDELSDPQRLGSFQANIAANGLPPEAIQALTSIGITNAQIQAAQSKLLAIDPHTVSGTLFGSMKNTATSARHASSKQPTQLANISTRLAVQTGDNVLIGGFIITGVQPKKVILRVIGPSLTLPGKLADPTIALYSGSKLLASNDNWMDSSNKQSIIDSTIPPTNPLESAILISLNPGAYTAIARGMNNTTGIGVIEVYDLDRTVDSTLANISTRGPVGTANNVLIGGFIVLGPDSEQVIVRALGPSVPVPGKLSDPTLELHDANGGLLEANDNWRDSPNKQAIIDSTIPPTQDLESAIIRTLPPANYTAIVRGTGATSGIAVVEVYALN